MSQYYQEKEAYWRSKVKDCQESGLSARQFCIQEELGYHSLLSWRIRFKESVDEFIEIREEHDGVFELGCGNITLRVSSELKRTDLRSVIIALHEASDHC